MRAATVVVTLSLVFASVPAIADDRKKLAAELMELQQARQSVDMGMQQMEEAMRAQLDQEQLATGKPNCTKDALVNIVKTEINWKVLEPKITQIYAEEFTEDELEDLVEFFKSKLGRTYLAKLPRVMARTQQVNQEVSQVAFTKLQTALQACRTGEGGGGGGGKR
jgi:hypothetical protein